MKKKQTVLQKYEEARKNRSAVLNLSYIPDLLIPEGLDKLIHLKRLELHNSGITIIPSSVFALKNLEYLHLGFNKITEVSGAIGQLRNLKILFLGGNFIKTLPDSILNLQQLKSIALHKNPKLDINDAIGKLIWLPGLEEFQISLYESFPEGITNLSNITKLVVSSDRLTSKELKIPDKIDQLVQLKHLDLSGCNLKELPETIGNLTNLEILDLKYNHVTTLPDSLLNLQNLKLLILKENPVAREPEDAKEQYLFNDVIDDTYYGLPILNDYLKQWQELMPNTEIITGP